MLDAAHTTHAKGKLTFQHRAACKVNGTTRPRGNSMLLTNSSKLIISTSSPDDNKNIHKCFSVFRVF